MLGKTDKKNLFSLMFFLAYLDLGQFKWSAWGWIAFLLKIYIFFLLSLKMPVYFRFVFPLSFFSELYFNNFHFKFLSYFFICVSLADWLMCVHFEPVAFFGNWKPNTSLCENNFVVCSLFCSVQVLRWCRKYNVKIDLRAINNRRQVCFQFGRNFLIYFFKVLTVIN